MMGLTLKEREDQQEGQGRLCIPRALGPHGTQLRARLS